MVESFLPKQHLGGFIQKIFQCMENLEQKIAVAAIVKEIRGLVKLGDFSKAEKVCAQGLIHYLDEPDLLSLHGEISVRSGNWSVALDRLERLLDSQGTRYERDKTVLRLARVCVAMGQPSAAEARIASGLAIHPGSLALRYAAAKVAVLRPGEARDASTWREFWIALGLAIHPGSYALRHAAAKVAMLRPGGAQDATPWRELAATPKLRRQRDSVRIPIVSACVSGLRLAGYPQEAQRLLAAHYDPADEAWRTYAKDGYGRLIVFDNGKTKVEFYTKLFDASHRPTEPRQLVITFDIMTQTWDGKPYTYKALSPLNYDFLAVRKRTKLDFHQDFSRADFLGMAAPIAALYSEVVAFGQSLGGYSALYYGTQLKHCRILATAPRNPQNPKYSGEPYGSAELFTHELEMPRHNTATPTIVFDPKNRQDNRYVEKSLRPAFPNARFIPYPYTGHSITRYLLEVGILKSTTLTFCNGIPFPDFDRSLRGGSAEYLRNLAKRNFAVGRQKWALALALRAKDLGTYPELTDAILKKLGYKLPAR
jgi:hypothetical protein